MRGGLHQEPTFRMPRTLHTFSFIRLLFTSWQYIRRRVSKYISTSSMSVISIRFGFARCCFDQRSESLAAKNLLCVTNMCRCTLTVTLYPSLLFRVSFRSLVAVSLNWFPGLLPIHCSHNHCQTTRRTSETIISYYPLGINSFTFRLPSEP